MPSGALISYTGPETFQLRNHVQRIFLASVEKYGEYNVSKVEIDPKATDMNMLKTMVFSIPFFGTGKRIIFLESFPFESSGKRSEEEKENEEKILKILQEIPEEIVVICISENPDRRTKAWKELQKIADKESSQEFSELKDQELTEWILQMIASKKGEILPAAAEYLWQYCGTNLWKLSNEIEKLILFTSGEKPISERDIEKVSEPSFETIQFALSNAFSSGKEEEVIEIFHRMIFNGESAYVVLYRDLGSIMRQLILTRVALDGKKSAEDVGINPFIFRHTQKTAALFPMTHLRTMHEKLIHIDEGTKTGAIPSHAGKEDHLIFAVEKWIRSFFSINESSHSKSSGFARPN
ncbi:DNA polymerase III subunit delta [Candidatus Peregrinibacteria bacterium]|nr:DNA polymerase III subunit delta [Candidatus Peregrinibacteria bacterium]